MSTGRLADSLAKFFVSSELAVNHSGNDSVVFILNELFMHENSDISEIGKSDFGSLHQVLFTSAPLQVEICFWELGWLGITVRNYETSKQLLHLLLEPDQEIEKDDAFRQLRELL